ncbi:MAG: FAD-dependent oxidoreductase, partial [Alphaproteobacteria bacterium]|nr:FAD-dependent oxidoreductase [Alphaproteobacteria bacterium]
MWGMRQAPGLTPDPCRRTLYTGTETSAWERCGMAGSGSYDVVVVGGGNAAFSAAMAAREQGAEVLMIERAPEDESGGNSRFTAGIIRFAFNGIDDLLKLIDLNDEEIKNTDFGTYTNDQFFDDMGRITQYRSDPEMVELLVTRSFDTMVWTRKKGIRFVPIYGRQAFKIDGKFKFWGGLALESWGGGPGLIQSWTDSAKRNGVEVLYGTRAYELISDGIRVHGLKVRSGDRLWEIPAKAVVLACGGFEANAEMRTRYLGPGWELAKVRGSRFNTGDGIKMALDVGAMPFGNWSGC